MVRLGRLLRISRYVGGLPSALPRLERHMEIECFKEHLSGSGYDYFDFGGW
jgi:hypothetical protein